MELAVLAALVEQVVPELMVMIVLQVLVQLVELVVPEEQVVQAVWFMAEVSLGGITLLEPFVIRMQVET